MKLGSIQHKKLFCRQFIDSHLEYEPETLPWPEMDSVSLERLQSIPFWHEALSVERRAGKMVAAFAETVQDPLLREAIELQAQEESRHARLIQHMIQRYGIQVTEPEEAELPENLDAAFTTFGFSECLDSFFAFGMFGIARQVQYMPEGLFEIFSPVLDEEARHIVFFINWITYHQIKQGRGWPGLRGAHSLWHYGQAILSTVKMFSGSNKTQSKRFTATGATSFMDNLTPSHFLTVCLEENRKRMEHFEPRLLQPRLLAQLSQVALEALKRWPRRYPAPAVEPSES